MVDLKILIPAFFLDLAIGDPRWLPHPVRVMGGAIARLEGLLRYWFGRTRERVAGLVLVIAIVVPVYIIMFLMERLLQSFSSEMMAALGMVVVVFLAATTLALRELIAASRRVIVLVESHDLDKARQELSMIVGRDTAQLPKEGVLRAVIETLAENLSDGIIAPMFYLVIGGLPLAMTYKAINTLDSMVGYRNERYLHFGWAAAKLDDVANYVPARISGFCIMIAALYLSLFRRSGRPFAAAREAFRIMLRDGRKHSSPNSGVPEAAMAGALGVALGGPSVYGGVRVEKPVINEGAEADYLFAANQAVMVTIAAAVAFFIGAVSIMAGTRMLT